MINKYCFSLLISLTAYLAGQSQNISQKISIDGYLDVTFPGKVTHFDSLGVSLFQTTVDHTTFQALKRSSLITQADEYKLGAQLSKLQEISMCLNIDEELNRNVARRLLALVDQL